MPAGWWHTPLGAVMFGGDRDPAALDAQDREMEAVKSAILASGLDDWVHIADVIQAARQARDEDDMGAAYRAESDQNRAELGELRDERLATSERATLPLGIEAVKELLRDGLIRIGEVSDTGFVAWNGAYQDLELRIDQAAAQAEFPLLPGHLFWIENTRAGDEVANAGPRRR